MPGRPRRARRVSRAPLPSRPPSPPRFAAAAAAARLRAAVRGPARPRLRHLRQPGRRHHRVPRRRLVDQAAASRLERARRHGGHAARRVRLHRPRDRARGRAWPLRGLRGRSRRGPARRRCSTRLGRDWELAELTFKPYPCGSIAQPYMDCAHAPARRGTGCAPATSAPSRCRTAAGPRAPALGAARRPSTRRPTATPRSSACPIWWRSILVQGPRGARRVRGRRGARPGRPRGDPEGDLRARPHHRLSAPVRRRRRDHPDRRPRAPRAPGSSAGRTRRAAHARGARGEVPRQRRRAARRPASSA